MSSPDAYATPWEALAAEDYPGFIRFLEAAGCPKPTIRDLVLVSLGRRRQQRVEEPLRRRVAESTWWREPYAPGQDQNWAPIMLRERHAFETEASRLLGLTPAQLRAGFGFWDGASTDWLSTDERVELISLQQRHAAEAAEIISRALPGTTGPMLTDALRAELRELRQRQREEIGRLLGPEKYAEYQVRESSEAQFVRRELPQARDAEEFRAMVRAAEETGIENPDIALDQMAAHLSPESLVVEPPNLREKVLAQLEAFTDPRRAEELSEEARAEIQRAEAERTAEKELARVRDLQDQARAGGAEISLDEARAFAEALETRGRELEQEWGNRITSLNSLTETERKQLQARMKAEFESVAVSVLGKERGRILTEQIAHRQEGEHEHP